MTGPTMLAPVSLANPFPLPADAPLVAYPAGDRLHVLARDPVRGQVRDVLVDADGHCEVNPHHLPLAYVNRAIPGRPVVSGSAQDGRPVVVDGDCVLSVPVEQPLAVHPIPCWVGHAAQLVWADKAGLRVATVEANTIQLTDFATPDGQPVDLEVTSDSLGLTIAATYTKPLRTELLHPPARRSLPRLPAMALAKAEGRHLLVWISSPEARPRRQWFGPTLAPLGPSALILEADQPGAARSIRFYVGCAGRLALGWHTDTAEWVALLDTVTGLATDCYPLADPGPRYGTGGWIGDRLIVLHGAVAPLVSVFQVT